MGKSAFPLTGKASVPKHKGGKSEREHFAGELRKHAPKKPAKPVELKMKPAGGKKK